MLAAVSDNAPKSEQQPATTPPLVAALTALLGTLACAGIAALLAWQAPQLRGTESGGGAALRPLRLQPCTLLEDGYLRGRLYGALRAEIDWRGRSLRCDGMLRPDGGMRLLFSAGDPAVGILFVLGIQAGPDDALGRELPVNLTIVDEDRDRFYNSGLGERCWVQLDRIQVLGRAGRREYNVAGEFYCAGALAAVNGPGEVTPADFRFSGRLSIDDE